MDHCIVTLNVAEIEKLCTKLKDGGQTEEQVRASLEMSLLKRAFMIGPSSSIGEVNSFLQFVISLAQEKLCAISLTVQVLQDMFDVSSIKRCEELFTIVEKNIDVFKTDFFVKSCKNSILRMCNDLLKRLSRIVNTSFCGRIIVLLAKSLPLNERSGLNLPGHFNIDNTTVFELDEEKMETEEVEEDRDEGELCDRNDRNITVNYNLYVKFWEIQTYFSNPTLLSDSTSFNKFENNLWDVFSVFSTYKLERPASTKNGDDEKDLSATPDGIKLNGALSNGVSNGCSSSPSQHAQRTENNHDFFENFSSDNFFTKYLTNQKLFSLQLADSQFRRYFLVQCLILANYLSTKIKTKDNTSTSFSTVQESFVKEITEKCHCLLKETYPRGSHFSEAIRRILMREKHWANWKSEGCNDLIEPLLKRPCGLIKRRNVDRFDPNVIDVSNKELNRLWNINACNIAACSDSSRSCVPHLKEFIDNGLDELDPDQQVEEQYKSVNNENYQWMASRFLLYNSDQYMNASVDLKTPYKSNSKFLEKAIHLTAASIPELNSKAERIKVALEKIEKKAEDVVVNNDDKNIKIEKKSEDVANSDDKNVKNANLNVSRRDKKEKRGERKKK